METLFEGRTGERTRKALLLVLLLLALFLFAEAVSAFLGLRYVGTGVAAANTISVSGHGEYLAVPDIATFSFSVVSDKQTVAAAQSDATAKANAVIAYLKAAGVADKDIQTTDYSINPQYSYQNAVCPPAASVSAPAIYNDGTVSSSVSSGGSSGAVVYCPPGKQVLTGYEVRQTTTVKVRDTTKAGDLLAGVGGKGATELSGLSFTFDDPTAPQQQARDKAIADAKQKAGVLAGQLDVSLVRVVSFTEGTNYPVYSNKVYGVASGVAAAADAAPTISVGQNKTTDDVTITYEIR